MAIATSYSTPANGTTAIWALINLLVANGWTVSAWTTGSAVGSVVNGAAVGNPYTNDSAASTGLANLSAWFRLTYTGSGGYSREWLFQRGSLATADYTWTVSRSRTGFLTGGTATVIPTDATTGQSLMAATQLFDATLASRLLISVNTGNGSWTLLTVLTGGGTTRTFIADEAMAAGTFSAADTDPYVFGAYWTTGGITAPYSVPPTPVTFYKRTRHGLASAANTVITMGPICSTVGTVLAPSTSPTLQVAPEPYGTNEVPIQIPVYKAGATGTATGWAGFTNGLRWSSVYGRSNGQTITDSANFWVYVGGMWVPWDSSVPTI